MAAGVVVNTNISSIHASRVLSTNRNDLETAMARLASGKRVNSAADDAAAASVALKMKADIASGDVAVRNINDGISLFQTLDGAASEVENILVRMRELASQMSNGTYASADATAANTEFTALTAEITRIADNTEFNRTDIANGTSGFQIQLGAAGADKVTFSNADLRAATLGLTTNRISNGNTFVATVAASSMTGFATAITGSNFTLNGVAFTAAATTSGAARAEQLVTAINGATWGSATAVNASYDAASGVFTLSSTAAIDVVGTVAANGFITGSTTGTSTANAAASLTAIDIALSKVSTARATAGSNINRLGFALSNAQNVSQRLNEALSGLQDTDYAAESANLARGMVLAQAGTAMLAQANQAPQYVLTLLRG
ncbi:MAG: flagellin [Gammaproteobacteria bacterium]|jgi:flagellin